MKVLIIGLGSIAKKHINALFIIDPEIEIFAFRSSPKSNLVPGVRNIYREEELTLHSPFDFAIISNPTSEHKKSIDLLLGLQIPLFIEKPLYHLLDIKSVLEKIDEKQILTYVACNLRFLDSLKYMEGILKRKHSRINEVNVYCGSYLPQWRNNSNYKLNYSAIPKLGGGVHLDLIHEIDYVCWIFGFPLKINKVLSNKSVLGIESYDYANFCLEYPTFNASIILNYYRRDAKRTLEVVCEDSTYQIDLLKNEIRANNELIYQSNQIILDTYLTQMKYFIQQLQKGQDTFNNAENAYEILKICLNDDIER